MYYRDEIIKASRFYFIYIKLQHKMFLLTIFIFFHKSKISFWTENVFHTTQCRRGWFICSLYRCAYTYKQVAMFIMGSKRTWHKSNTIENFDTSEILDCKTMNTAKISLFLLTKLWFSDCTRNFVRNNSFLIIKIGIEDPEIQTNFGC